jgi:segregation and condensation protein B
VLATELKPILEAAILASHQPLTLEQLSELFEESARPSHTELAQGLEALQSDCENRGIELVEVASGFRFQVKSDMHAHVSRLWTERQSKYSRALLETLALIAYRQPITRAEIEAVRGVTVSSHIIRTLEEREWIRVVGHREVPGRPALYGTTRTFLDYFKLKSLEELPTLSEIKDFENIEPEFDFGVQAIGSAAELSGLAQAHADLPDAETAANADPAETQTTADDAAMPASTQAEVDADSSHATPLDTSQVSETDS